MSKSKTTQKNNIAKNISARDTIDKSTHIGQLNVSKELKKGELRNLIDKYQYEVENNYEFREIICSLQHFMDSIDTNEVIGLKDKMNKAKRSDQIQNAELLKELFTKQLKSKILSKSAQKIFAYLLGKIHVLFDTYVQPLIIEGKDRKEIDKVVLDKVLTPVFEELGQHDFGIYYQEIRGMLYFLTGNCHIRWHGDN